MSTTMSALTVQFLAWIDAAPAEAPRMYADAMEAWRSNCPRMPVWEDALDAGLITIDFAAAARQGTAAVRLTGAGRRMLADAAS